MTKFDTPIGCKCNGCKRCKNRIKAKRWRERKPDHLKNYYVENKERINAVSKKWKEDNVERVKEWNHEYGKEYCKRPEVIERRNEQNKKRSADPKERKKIQARKVVQQAVRRGSVQRQPCEVCGTTEDIHAHHKDYDLPYDVQWLCRTHHIEIHKN